MNSQNRPFWFIILVVLAIAILTLVSAPLSQQGQQGSTYSREPGGYGAWYAYMQNHGTPIQRWQRPLAELFETGKKTPQFQEVQASDGQSIGAQVNLANLVSQENQATPKPKPKPPITLIQVSNGTTPLLVPVPELVEVGNVFVLVGVRSPASRAAFASVLNSPVGNVKIETTRRLSPRLGGGDSGRRDSNVQDSGVGDSSVGDSSVGNLSAEADGDRWGLQTRLADPFGIVVGEHQMGRGRIIYISTPFLGANAYQDEPGNFKFLAKLVNDTGNPVLVDEYLHGYVDPAPAGAEDAQPRQLWDYLGQTPLPIVLVQAIVLLAVMIVGLNQRFGRAVQLRHVKLDNSEAYIAALATVLQKANSSEFVVETIGKAEQIEIQRSLGLGIDPLELTAIGAAWAQQTGRSAQELQQVLAPLHQSHRFSQVELATWLAKLKLIRSHLPYI